MVSNEQYIKDLEEFITDELMPAYIENCARLGRDPNQSYIIKKLVGIMKVKKELPALLRNRVNELPKKKLS